MLALVQGTRLLPDEVRALLGADFGKLRVGPLRNDFLLADLIVLDGHPSRQILALLKLDVTPLDRLNSDGC